jgi:hypothetical protein
MLARNQRGAGASDTLTNAAFRAGFSPVVSGQRSLATEDRLLEATDASAIGFD